jgi:hypothetical protein
VQSVLRVCYEILEAKKRCNPLNMVGPAGLEPATKGL